MLLTAPYCTTAELQEYPTLLDLLDLRSSDPSVVHQTAILNKLLFEATEWCDNYVELSDSGTLTAHTRTENKRMRPDRYGRLLLHPDHIPFVSLTSVAYGRTIGSLTTYPSPATFLEDGRQLVVDMQAGSSSWVGSLQFGNPPPGAELYTTWVYVAGFPNTLLTGNISTGGTSLPVADVTGVQPGQTLRIYDPGQDENITVAATWTPATGPASLPLAAGVANTHTTTNPVRVSAMGHNIFQACVLYTISLLMRPDSQAEDAFPDMRAGISTRLGDSRKDGSGLVFEAEHLLEPLRRVR